MIPVTVNFFVKQGEKNKGTATRLAIAYCLSIIGIFTGLGLLFLGVPGRRFAQFAWPIIRG